MKKIYLFLDFDGVLHGEGQDSKGFFEHIPAFCDTLRKHSSQIKIVISSSWREDHPLPFLQSLFEDDIRPLIIDVTPLHEKSYDIAGRQGEIEEYCNQNKITSNQWIAIDDMKMFFNIDCSNLFLINSITGLTKENLHQLSLLIEEKFNLINDYSTKIKI